MAMRLPTKTMELEGAMSRDDSISAQAIRVARPEWAGIVTASEAIGLEPDELLHAGPRLRDPTDPPAVLLSSAVVTLVHEGRAADLGAAERLVRTGAVCLVPAQERGCALPLAFVASASTPMCVVTDAGLGGSQRFAPLTTLRGFDTRMGTRDEGLFARMSWRDTVIAPSLQEVLAAYGPLPLLPLANAGLAAGDDLHSRTTAANSALSAWLWGTGAANLSDDVEATPLFFLTLWMAACSLVLGSAERVEGSTLISRAGGNGESFGIALAGAPGQWLTIEADPPRGRMAQRAHDGVEVCGAIGDSAIVDMLGFGGQRLSWAPEPRQALEGFLPEALEGRAEQLLETLHPLISPPWRVGIDVQRLEHLRLAPIVLLSMLARDGMTGFVGRGVYLPPLELFTDALEALRTRPAEIPSPHPVDSGDKQSLHG
ncbi:MAG: DUF1116 domain-containing protein [Caldimonas sp.]